MSKILYIPMCLAVLGVAGCASVPAGSRTTGTTKVDETAVNAIYAELEQASARFEAGLKSEGAADAQASTAELDAALAKLQESAAKCAVTAGCDSGRFLSTYDRLLRLDSTDVAGQVVEVGDADVPGEAGESSPVVASLPAMERTITLLKGRELADILTINDAVKAGLEQWLTQYRPNLMTTYVNYQFMRYQMWPQYHEAGLPEALLFGMLAKESGGRVHAVSRSGASGPLQFMYGTGLRFGLGNANGFDQRFDPALSARANAAYINEQLAVFNGNLELVIAAYNGGEGRMRRLAGRGGNSSFWDPAIYSNLPDETRDYVPMVLAAAWLFLHPERYNLEFPQVDGRAGEIVLAQDASIAELTVCFGNAGGMGDGWFRVLRNLNPALDSQEQVKAGTRLQVPAQLEAVYAGKCAGGQWAVMAEDLSRATRVSTRGTSAHASASRTTAKLYKVRKGDNLAKIARQHGCSGPRDIAQANGIKAPQYRIRTGQTLRIPACHKR